MCSLRRTFVILFSIFAFCYFYSKGDREFQKYYPPLSVNATYYLDTTFSDAVKSNIRVLNEAKLALHFATRGAVKPFIHLKSYLKVPRRYNVGTCSIPKVMGTVLKNMFCYLHEPKRFVRGKNSLLQYNDVCSDDNKFCNFTALRKERGSRMAIAVLLRDPTERFISGFVDKCINELSHSPKNCFNCKGSMECVLENLYKMFKLIGMNILPLNIKREYDYELIHFAPQTWYCEMDETFEDVYFIKYEEASEKEGMILQIQSFLLNSGVDSSEVEYIINEMTGEKKTAHSTLESSNREIYTDELKKDPSLMKMLKQIYRFDYEILNTMHYRGRFD